MVDVLFLGRKKVSAACLDWLLAQPGVSVTGVLTDSHLERSVTRDIAEKHGIPLHTFETALTAIQNGELRFELGVSMLYWRKLNEIFLDQPARGIINFHPAPLPQYKGVGGYNLAILDTLDVWSATAHYVDGEIDTGDIVGQTEFGIDPQKETAYSLERTTQDHLEQLFRTTVAAALATPGLLPTTPNGPGRYLSRPELESMKRIDPECDDIERKVRAFWFPPYDGAYLELNGQRFTLATRDILATLADPDASSLFSNAASASQAPGSD